MGLNNNINNSVEADYHFNFVINSSIIIQVHVTLKLIQNFATTFMEVKRDYSKSGSYKDLSPNLQQ